MLCLKLLLPRKESPSAAPVLGVLALLVEGAEEEVAVLAEHLLQLHPLQDLLPEDLERGGARARPRPHVAPGQRPRRPLPRLCPGIRRLRRRGEDAHGAAEGRRAAAAGGEGAAAEEGAVAGGGGRGLARAERGGGQVERRREALQLEEKMLSLSTV